VSATLHPSAVRDLLAEGGGRLLALLDCGAGADAAALTAAGWRVVGLDASELDIGLARRAQPDCDWELANPVLDEIWPLETVDVAYWAARGSEFERRRVLRRVRRHLAPDGLLYVEGMGECETLVRQAGFSIKHVQGSAVVARPVAQPPQGLAVAEWGIAATASLDLRYAPDETALLELSAEQIWQEVLGGAAGAADHYPVDDPYGAARGAAAVARFYARPLAPQQVTFSSGVTSLLRDLAGLADGGPIIAPELVHPDLENWAVALGSTVVTVPEPATRTDVAGAVRRHGGALVHLDRPGFAADAMSLSDLERIAAAGAPVLVDESAAAYLGAQASAVQLVGRLDNLVVVRGFTKAYSLGGLRIGFAVASPAIAVRVRELVTPMGAGGLALQTALAMLDAGDVFGRLRIRIRRCKRTMARLLETHGLHPLASHPDVPWLAVDDRGGRASAALGAAGIRGLPPVPVPGASAPATELLHLTVPLSDERMALLRDLLA
jgi:histidinol-phosphate/aromatic aminotransferase/cobyric acid decarboxylase-like protein